MSGVDRRSVADAAAPPSSRRFLALPIPAAVRDALSRVLPPTERHAVRWTRPAGWHLTLAFLGDVEDARVGEVTAAARSGLDGSPLHPTELATGGLGRFGARVLWVAVDDTPTGALQTLAGSLRAALTEHGLSVADRPFNAHVTLARAGRRRIDDAILAACEPPPTLRWRPDAVELWRSHLGRGPARYEVEARLPLDP